MQAPALELKKGRNLQNTGSSHPTTMGLWWTGEPPSQGKESVHRSWPSHLASGTHLCVASSAAGTKCSTGWASAAHICSSIQQIFMQHLYVPGITWALVAWWTHPLRSLLMLHAPVGKEEDNTQVSKYMNKIASDNCSVEYKTERWAGECWGGGGQQREVTRKL